MLFATCNGHIMRVFLVQCTYILRSSQSCSEVCVCVYLINLTEWSCSDLHIGLVKIRTKKCPSFQNYTQSCAAVRKSHDKRQNWKLKTKLIILEKGNSLHICNNGCLLNGHLLIYKFCEKKKSA